VAESKRGSGFTRVDQTDVMQRLLKAVHERQATESAEAAKKEIESSRGMTANERRHVEAAALIRQEEPSAEELAFMARELVQCTLPHSDPGQVPFWSRRNGNFMLSMQAGVDPRKNRLIGYPYGSIPRLLLFFLTSEALRKGERRIVLGATYNDFLRQVGYSVKSGGGKRSDAARVKEQATRLFNTRISFLYGEPEGHQAQQSRPAIQHAARHMNVASNILFWWDTKTPDQLGLWENSIELSEEFFSAITAAPVPLDTRALKDLRRSPLALDLYAWSTHKALAVARRGKQQFIPWRYLAAQFGSDYSNHLDFKRKALVALKRIQGVYPGLKLNVIKGGVVVLPTSLPSVGSKPSARQLGPRK
jgi:hypothetical protein